jgi:hypothetical protein
MNSIILCRSRVLIRGGSEIPIFVEVDLEIVCEHRPYTNIELPLLVEKRFFDVFLEDPACVAYWHRKQELLDISQIPKNFNSTPLISVFWFDEPNIF